MKNSSETVCITGASGMVGSAVVRSLLAEGRRNLRILSRTEKWIQPEVDLVIGDLLDAGVLSRFLDGATSLYHCAAELWEEERMWRVNVEGTDLLMRLAAEAGIRSYCHLSSAGVVGAATGDWVDETAPCSPRNAYEQSKYAAEQLACQGIPGCSTVILRPTNVIDDNRPGLLTLPMRRSLRDRMMLWLKGGECAHLVHAQDVAAAALFLMGRNFETPEVFFVSCDDDPSDTIAGLWALHDAIRGTTPDSFRLPAHLPPAVPHLLRAMVRGAANRGDLRYSNRKLLNTGFRFPLGLRGAAHRLMQKEAM